MESPRPDTPRPVEPSPSRFGRLRAATDRVPTKWFAAIGTALFLAVTAAFGGLATAAAEPATPLAELTAGETHTDAQLSTTVQRAVLIDALPGSGARPGVGERLLVLVVDVENRWTEPLMAGLGGPDGYAGSIHVKGDDRLAVGLVREDDTTSSPWLQPGVPTTLVLSWTVPAETYRDGENLAVVLGDTTRAKGQLLFDDEYWTERAPAAEVTLAIEDVGAGKEPAS